MRTFSIGRYTVNRVGYGAMQLTGSGVFGPPADRGKALAILRRAVEAGVNHIDTADFYGPRVVNELIREALYPYPTDLVVVSKVGARRTADGGIHAWDEPADLRRGIEDNLRALGVSHLPAVNLRVMGDRVADARFEAQVGTMVQACEDGLIGGVGLSNVSLDQLRAALRITEVACVQNSFSPLDRGSAGVLRECARRGIAFVPFVPLGFPRPRREAILSDPVVVGVARALDLTPAQVVLAFLAAVSPNVLLIPGTSSMRHLEENLAVSRVELDAPTIARLEGAFAGRDR
ncbi:oxidoreductase [Dactylosporangium cerinum]|uniref:Oxidoreductase n=1 Tax=Dactylosporangium cerinum TaxID=1434730 RepID=A0ABV9WGL1_9ACTN